MKSAFVPGRQREDEDLCYETVLENEQKRLASVGTIGSGILKFTIDCLDVGGGLTLVQLSNGKTSRALQGFVTLGTLPICLNQTQLLVTGRMRGRPEFAQPQIMKLSLKY